MLLVLPAFRQTLPSPRKLRCFKDNQRHNHRKARSSADFCRTRNQLRNAIIKDGWTCSIFAALAATRRDFKPIPVICRKLRNLSTHRIIVTTPKVDSPKRKGANHCPGAETSMQHKPKQQPNNDQSNTHNRQLVRQRKRPLRSRRLQSLSASSAFGDLVNVGKRQPTIFQNKGLSITKHRKAHPATRQPRHSRFTLFCGNHVTSLRSISP
jgi:hypothetical protein